MKMQPVRMRIWACWLLLMLSGSSVVDSFSTVRPTAGSSSRTVSPVRNSLTFGHDRVLSQTTNPSTFSNPRSQHVQFHEMTAAAADPRRRRSLTGGSPTTKTTTTSLSMAAGVPVAAGILTGGLLGGALHAIAGTFVVQLLQNRCFGCGWYCCCSSSFLTWTFFCIIATFVPLCWL